MGMVYFINNDEVQRLLSLKDCMETTESAYREWDAGQAAIRSKTSLYVYNREENTRYNFTSMEGAVQSLGIFAIRMRSDIERRLSSTVMGRKPAGTENGYCGLILLFSTRTKELLAIINDGYIQHARVAAVAGIAAKYLARKDASVLCLLGSQWMARTHALAFCEARPIKVIQVYSPTKEHREAFAREVGDRLGVEVRVMTSAEDAVRGAHIVACCTDSHRNAVLRGEWLEEGMFISNVLAAEMDEKTLARIDYAVKNQPLRNLDSAVNIAGVPPEGVTPPSEGRGWLKQVNQDTPLLSELIVGKAKGRLNDRQITFFCNNEGTGIQFAAAGAVILDKLKEKGLRDIKEIPTEWFFQNIPD